MTLPLPALIENARKTIWLIRPDLRQLCHDDPAQLDCWLALNGHREYAIFDTPLPPALPPLSDNSAMARPDVRPGLTVFLQYLWQTRPDLQRIFPLDSQEGQQGFIWWYVFHGVPENDLFRLVTDEQKDILAEPDPSVPQDAAFPISRLMAELWRRHPDLQTAFPLQTSEGRSKFHQWYSLHGREIAGIGRLFDDVQDRALKSSPTPPDVRIVQEPLLPGVNVIGFARGEFGIGEDVRMAALSLQTVGIPCSIYNVDPGPLISQNDHSADALIRENRPYSVNLFCMTGIDMATLVARQGPSILQGRYNIGVWPWELPEWPTAWQHAYDLVDEVWAASRYTYDAFVKSCPKPVRHVPSAVTVDATEHAGRAAFGLPEGPFLFVFSFDVLSSFARKNPLACIEAFRTAFPRGDEPVGLVIKAMRADPADPAWQTLLADAGGDPRITILTETFSRGRLLDLYRACDCFLSLHRAEGFGRCIAEAMMLGKPVIATGYSGNLDFTMLGGAALVDYRLQQVTASDYSFGEMQLWSEPDTDHAAHWMKRLVDDSWLRTRMSNHGRLMVNTAYTPKAVGDMYRSASLARLFSSIIAS